MRDKGLVFDEMRRAQQTLARPFSERWIELAVGLAFLLLLALQAERRATVAPPSRADDREIRHREAWTVRLDSAAEDVGGANGGADAE